MQKFEISTTLYDGEEVTNHFSLTFTPVEDNLYQPVIKVKNAKTGLEFDLKLPKASYTNIREIAETLGKEVNPQGVEKIARKVVAILSLMR